MKLNTQNIFIVGLLIAGLMFFPGHELSPAEGESGAASAPSSSAGTAAEEAEGGFTPYSEAEEVEEPKKGLDEKISLDLRNIDVVDALRFLAMKGGLNLAVSKSVSGRLLLLLENVPIRDVLDIILRTNALAFDKQGEVYNIMTEVEYKERYGRKFSDTRKVKIYRLKYAIPDRVFAAVDALKTEIGRVLVDQESGMVLVMDTEENLTRVDQAIATLEQKQTVRAFALQYAKAKDVEERLRTQLDTKNAGTVVADDWSNQVIIQTFPERMDAIAQLISSLDQKTKEVLIVSKIIKVTLSDDYDAEIRWEAFFRNISFLRPLHDSDDSTNFLGNHGTDVFTRTGTTFSNDLGNIARAAVPAAGSKNELTENLFFGFLGRDNSFEGVLKYLRTVGDTRVISNPRLTVVNNQEAKIHVGDREAYITSTTTSGSSGTNTTAEAVTFVDVGIQLSVTPTINDEGFITMRIKPSISSVVRTLITGQNNRIPIIDTSEAETTVMVKDGTTVVLAGLRRDEDINSERRTPFFGDIPILGRLFRNVNNEKKRTELLILLTPTIVTGEQFMVEHPVPPEEGIKSYRDYSSVDAKPEKKSGIPNPFF